MLLARLEAPIFLCDEPGCRNFLRRSLALYLRISHPMSRRKLFSIRLATESNALANNTVRYRSGLALPFVAIVITTSSLMFLKDHVSKRLGTAPRAPGTNDAPLGNRCYPYRISPNDNSQPSRARSYSPSDPAN